MCTEVRCFLAALQYVLSQFTQRDKTHGHLIYNFEASERWPRLCLLLLTRAIHSLGKRETEQFPANQPVRLTPVVEGSRYYGYAGESKGAHSSHLMTIKLEMT